MRLIANANPPVTILRIALKAKCQHENHVDIQQKLRPGSYALLYFPRDKNRILFPDRAGNNGDIITLQFNGEFNLYS